MDDAKVFCVNCLNLVNPKTHHDCTLTFDNLVDEEERGDAGNFRQNGEAVAVESSQIINRNTCQGRNESNHLMYKHPTFENPETPIQYQPNEMSSDSDSMSPPVLEAQNLGPQTSRHTDYGNNDPNFYGVNPRGFYESSSHLYNMVHPVYPHFLIGQKFGQIASNIQQENEFQNAMPQDNGKNKFHQEYPQSSYGQNFAKNSLPPPPFFQHFYTSFPTSMQNEGRNTFGQMGYHPHFNYFHSQNQYVPYEPQTNNKVSPSHNKNVENYSDSIKTSPISPARVAIPKACNLSVNREKESLAQNRPSSFTHVSKKELTKENLVEPDTVQNRLLKNNPQSTPQKSDDSIRKNKKSPHQKTENTNTPQKNVKGSSIKTSQISPDHTIIAKACNLSVNSDIELLGQNRLPSPNLTSKTESMRENIVELDTEQSRLLKNNTQSTPQKIVNSTQKNRKSQHHETEKTITPQKNVKESSRRTSPTSPSQTVNAMAFDLSVNTDNDLLGQNRLTSPNIASKTESTRESIDLNTVQSQLWKNNTQSTPQKIVSSTQKNRKSQHQKTEKTITPQKNVKGSSRRTSLISPSQTVNTMAFDLSVNTDNDLLEQNRLTSPNLASKTESTRESIELDRVQNRLMKNNSPSTPQKSDNSTKMYKKKAQQKNKKSQYQKSEKQITPQKNVKGSIPQKNKEQSIHQNNTVINSSEEHSDGNLLLKVAEKEVKGKNAEKGVHANNDEKVTDAEDSQKDGKNPEQDVNTKDVEDAENAKDVEDGENAKDVSSEQEKTGRFTGEGYKSIEEFIEALYNGTLYKRY